MATRTLARQSRTAGTRVQSAELSVQRATWSTLRSTVNITAPDLLNPATEVEVGIEWSPDGVVWHLVAYVGLVGSAASTVVAPFLEIGPEWRAWLGEHLTARVRVYVRMKRQGAVGVTMEAL